MDYEREKREAEELKTRMEKAKEKLYSPSAPDLVRLRHQGPLNQEEVKLPSQSWEPVSAPSPRKPVNIDKVNVLFRKILIGAVIFFVLSLGAAAGMYFYGSNIISARNIAIDINAPSSAASSDPLSFDISIQNGNNADLIDSFLIIDYPEGTRSVEDDTRPVVSERVEIGMVAKGAIVKKTASAKLFGEENTTKAIKVTFQYKIAGSTGTFSKDVSFDVALRQAPVVISVDALQEANSNQDIVLTARIISNSNNELQNTALNVEYPFGFTYKEASLEVESGKSGLFPLGNLLPNETKEVVIKGTISGQSAEDKIFKFTVGTASSDKPSEVSTVLVTYNHEMVIQSDFFASSIVSNSVHKYVEAGEGFQSAISWKNTLNTPVHDAEFSLKITGDLIDQQYINADQAFYDSAKSLIVWNKSTDPDLTEVAPGAGDRLSFFIPLFSYEKAIQNRIINPKVNLDLNIKARRLTDNNVPEDIISSFTKTIPVVTSVEFEGESFYASGPLKNSGPIPPRVGQKTTYTVTLTVANSVNDISDAEVVANLPLYVTFENEVTPSSDKISWNQNARQIRWKIGDIPARTGYGTSPRSISFKVGFIPSSTQIGDAPVLVRDLVFSGYDDFADATLTISENDIGTEVQDPGFVFGNDRVIQ